MARKLVAEGLGTFILVFFAVGSAVGGINVIGPAGVAFAFGLVLLALVYAIGPVSGCHVNPAVTLGALISGRVNLNEAVGYWVVQFIGGIAGGAMLKLMTSSFGKVVDRTDGLGTDAYGKHISGGGGCFRARDRPDVPPRLRGAHGHREAGRRRFRRVGDRPVADRDPPGGHPAGRHVGEPDTGAPALFEGGTALSQVWLFIVAPFVGGVLAAGVNIFLRSESKPLEPELKAEA